MPNEYSLAGILFDCTDKSSAISDQKALKIILPFNAQLIKLYHTDPNFRNSIFNFRITVDGQVPLLLLRMKYRQNNIEKLSGSDLVYSLIGQAEKLNRSIYLLGSTKDSNEIAQCNIASKNHIRVSGDSPDFTQCMQSGEYANQVRDKILQFRPDYMFLAFGAPKEQIWIERNMDWLRESDIRIILCSGGSVDFLSGKFKRAPVLVQRLCLEGIYRLIQEPSWKRIKRLCNSLSIFYYAIRY